VRVCRLNERTKCERDKFQERPKVEVKISKVTSKRKKEKMSFYFKYDLSSFTLIFGFPAT
jgi:hypothetical protein